MLLYFMVLTYGQGVANSVITEKTSKLMDTFLVSVKPTAMVFGKVLAIALSGMLQLFCWIVMAIAGFILGTHAVRAINPDSDMALLAFFDTLELFGGAFSLPGVIVGILILLAGFLLYCSLAAIGGSISEKPEDLANTNVLFSMVLVLSFFAVLYQGGVMNFEAMDAGESALGAAWLNWVPFTAIMIAPSRLMLGDLSLLQGFGCLAVVLATSALIMALAGRVYRLMALYKGNPPKIRQLITMLKTSK
jgi:ABC-type Na+ efflux pump permease subunit